jgi:hypothetical protein
MDGQNGEVAKTAIKCRQHLGEAVGRQIRARTPPDFRVRLAAWIRLASPPSPHGRSRGLVRRGAVPHRIIERWIHQDDIDTVGRQAGSSEGVGRRCNVKHDDISGIALGGVAACSSASASSISTSTSSIRHAPGHRQIGGADAGAEINHPVA